MNCLRSILVLLAWLALTAQDGDGIVRWFQDNAANGLDADVTIRVAGVDDRSGRITAADAGSVSFLAQGAKATVPWQAFDGEARYLLAVQVSSRMPGTVVQEALLLGAGGPSGSTAAYLGMLNDLRRRCPELAVAVDAALAGQRAFQARPNTERQPRARLTAHPLAGVLPWGMPTVERMREGRGKVFAHYFLPYPLSLDNKPADQDYYTQNYLRPEGESGKFAAVGGLLRERPLPRVPIRDPDWQSRDLEEEIRRAMAAGIDGFAVDLLWADDRDGRVRRLLDAAAAVSPDFRIMLMPDMTAGLKSNPDAVAPLILALAGHPAVYRLDDGRTVVAPFKAETHPSSWWRARLGQIEVGGVKPAYLPLFLNWVISGKEQAPIAAGMSDWGIRGIEDRGLVFGNAAAARRLAPIWMQSVNAQDARPKASQYFETAGSAAYRSQWEGAIRGGSDLIHIVTWNDYSECSEISPSSGIGHVFYDLTAYYAAWFKTGEPPPVRNDAAMLIHRIQRSDLVPTAGLRWGCRSTGGAVDEVEALVTLIAPAEVEVLSGDVSLTRVQRPAGMHAVRAPLQPGRITCRIIRGGRPVLTFVSPHQVVSTAPHQDLLYRGSASYRQEPRP